MKKPLVFFSIADANNLSYFHKLKKSFEHFHPSIPLLLYDEPKIVPYNDPNFWYRATPMIGKELLKEYETVIKIDADSVVTGDLSELWNGDFDIGVVNNSNPREFKTFPYQYRNVHPFAYVNCGLVVMKSLSFVEYWYDKCFSSLFNTQMREQDMLNDLVFDNHWSVKKFDEGDSFYGLASKGYWPNIQLLADHRLLLPKGTELKEPWPDKEKYIKVLHFGGGNIPNKMNFNTLFQPEVAAYLKEITT